MMVANSSNFYRCVKKSHYGYEKFNYLMLVFCDLVMKDPLLAAGCFKLCLKLLNNQCEQNVVTDLINASDTVNHIMMKR